MLKIIRKILHFILKFEISILFFILYYVVIAPMSCFQKIIRLIKNNHVQKTNWSEFTEKYQTLEDLEGEG